MYSATCCVLTGSTVLSTSKISWIRKVLLIATGHNPLSQTWSLMAITSWCCNMGKPGVLCESSFIKLSWSLYAKEIMLKSRKQKQPAGFLHGHKTIRSIPRNIATVKYYHVPRYNTSFLFRVSANELSIRDSDKNCWRWWSGCTISWRSGLWFYRWERPLQLARSLFLKSFRSGLWGTGGAEPSKSMNLWHHFILKSLTKSTTKSPQSTGGWHHEEPFDGPRSLSKEK